jgi:hypothetical protein
MKDPATLAFGTNLKFFFLAVAEKSLGQSDAMDKKSMDLSVIHLFAW